MLDHLEALARRTGRRPTLLDVPPLPPETEHLWSWFITLHPSRPPDRPLSFPEIDAWARLTGETPAPWEVAALRAVDRAWLDEMRQR